MNDKHIKQSPMLTLPSLGGGSHSPLVRKPPAGGGGGGDSWNFDISTGSFNGKSPHYRYTSQVNSMTTGFFLKPDGTAFYTMNSSADKVRRHNMTSAWDITTCSYHSVTSSGLTHPGGGPSKGLYFKSDGTKLFYIDSTHIRAYTLSSAWDITNISAASDSYNFSSNLTSGSSASSLNFKPDGTKVYISETAGSTGNTIMEFNLSSAWDLSTVSFVQKDGTAILDSGLNNNVRGFGFGNNGAYVNISSAANTYGRRLSLTTPWDISTLSTTGAIWTQHYQITNGFYGYGLNWQWRDNGLQYYFMGDNDEMINECKPTSAWAVGSGASGNEHTFKNTAYYVDFCNPYKQFGGQSNYALRWVDSGNKMLTTGGYSLRMRIASTPYDMKSLSTSGGSYSSAPGYAPREMTMNSTGTKLLWGPEGQYKNIVEYSLSSAWDLSTMSSQNTYSLTGQISSVQSGTVSDDGKYIYVSQSSTIYQWTMSTPFDLSTASYTQSQSGFSGSEGAIKFNHDGTQLIACNNSAQIKSYTLSTGFDISTASYDNKSLTIDYTLDDGIPPLSWNPCMTIAPGVNKIGFFPYYGAYAFAITFS